MIVYVCACVRPTLPQKGERQYGRREFVCKKKTSPVNVQGDDRLTWRRISRSFCGLVKGSDKERGLVVLKETTYCEYVRKRFSFDPGIIRRNRDLLSRSSYIRARGPFSALS